LYSAKSDWISFVYAPLDEIITINVQKKVAKCNSILAFSHKKHYILRMTFSVISIFPAFNKFPTARLNSFLLMPVSRLKFRVRVLVAVKPGAASVTIHWT
jgi:hypothetical protein